jgi:hypothetical protein
MKPFSSQTRSKKHVFRVKKRWIISVFHVILEDFEEFLLVLSRDPKKGIRGQPHE